MNPAIPEKMLNLANRPAGLIFDMDGTLLDTEPLYSVATQKLLDPYQVEFTLALKRQCMGGDSHRSAQIVIDEFKLPLDSTEYLAKREVFLIELFLDAPEMPGAAEFIKTLTNSDLPFGLATSSHQHLCDLKFKSKPWGQGFGQIVCGDHADLKRGKPHPDIFLLCAKQLNVDPGACIAFEDSPNGVKAAVAAGMKVIGINSPYIEEGALSDAEFVIDHYDELSPLLASWLKG